MTWARHVPRNIFCHTEHCHIIFLLQINKHANTIHQLSNHPSNLLTINNEELILQSVD